MLVPDPPSVIMSGTPAAQISGLQLHCKKFRSSTVLSFSGGLISSTRAFLHTDNLQSGTDDRLVRTTGSESTQVPFQIFPTSKIKTRYYTIYIMYT